MTKHHPEDITAGAADSAALSPLEEDSESSSQPQQDITPAARARKLADDILHTPTTTAQAIELATVYALIAIAEAITQEKNS